MIELNNDPLIISYISKNQFGKLIGMEFNIKDFGAVEYSLNIEEKHLATPNAAHGGVVASLLDSTIGVGALSVVCQEGKVVSTVEMKLTFFSPVFLNDILTAKSVLLKQGKHLLFMEAEVRNQNNQLIAKASGTLNSYPKEKAGY